MADYLLPRSAATPAASPADQPSPTLTTSAPPLLVHPLGEGAGGVTVRLTCPAPPTTLQTKTRDEGRLD